MEEVEEYLILSHSHMFPPLALKTATREQYRGGRRPIHGQQ